MQSRGLFSQRLGLPRPLPLSLAPQIFIDFRQKRPTPRLLWQKDNFARGLWQFLQNGLVGKQGGTMSLEVGKSSPYWAFNLAMSWRNVCLKYFICQWISFFLLAVLPSNVACSIDRNWMKFSWAWKVFWGQGELGMLLKRILFKQI